MLKLIRIILIFIFVTGLFANDNNLTAVINQIPKSSPNYTLADAIVKKLKILKPEQIAFNVNKINNQWDYEKDFYFLVSYKKEQLLLPDKIKDLSDRIDYLKNSNDPISQLQLIYYKKELNILGKNLNFINNNLLQYEEKLFKKLKNIKLDTDYAGKQINYWNNLLLRKQKEYEKLKIDLQKWQILNNSKNIQLMQRYIQINKEKQKKIYKNLIDDYLIIWFDKLRNKDKHIFDLTKTIINYAQNTDKIYANSLNSIMFDFEKFAFGKKIFFYESKNGLKILLQKMNLFFDYPLFKVSNKTITPLDFFGMLIIIIIGWIIGKYYKKLIYSIRKKYDVSYSTATLLANIGYYFILTLTFLIALKSVGLNLSSLAIIAGALSVGIGFGLQNIVSNFVSGIILMFEKSIKIGDYIEIDNNTRGEVIDITMRSTIIKTNDNINLIVPNQNLIQNNVINWTMEDDIVRFKIPFGVAYGSRVDKVEEVVLESIEKSNLPHIKGDKLTTNHYSPIVVFMEMGNSSLNFELYVWLRGEYAKRPRRTRGLYLKVIYKVLQENGIEIPFPQNDIHFRNMLEVKLKDQK